MSLVKLAGTRPQPDYQRIGFLVAGLAGRSICFLGGCLVVVWCRYLRRPSSLARPVLLLTLLYFVLHLTLSIINIILILFWRSSSTFERSVSDRCSWGIDVLWRLGVSGSICPRPDGNATISHQMSWLVAGGLRLLVVLIVGVSNTPVAMV